MTKLKPAAFLSYVHSDDQYGHLTAFRERLSYEVRMQTGEEFRSEERRVGKECRL